MLSQDYLDVLSAFSDAGVEFLALCLQIGVVPHRIDILAGISKVTFAAAWPDRATTRVADHDVPVIGRAALLRNKEATGRLRDLADAHEIRGES